MNEHRPHANGEAPSLARRLRALVGHVSDAPLPRPRTPRLELVRRSWIPAFWHTRIAVRAGMSLDDFLRSRLARYLAGLAVPSSRLPLSVSIDDGQVSVKPAEAPERAPAPPRASERDGWLAPLVAIEGPSIAQEVTELDVRLAVLEGEVENARHRAEELAHRFAADVASGLVAAPPAVDATAEQMGRPPVRSATPRTVMLTFVAAAIAAETWQVALPLLASAGLDAAAIASELGRRPGDVVSVSLFALGVSASLFALAHAGLGAAAELSAGGTDARRQRWLVAAAGAAGVFTALIATSVAALPRTPAAAAVPLWSHALLLFAVPVATALVLRAARREDRARDEETAAALAWDRERARALAERARRLEELSWAEDEQRSLEQQRDALRRRLREVSARAIQAARLQAGDEQRERAALSRLAQSLVAALELDRYEFVRQAFGRGALDLVSSKRRKSTEARAAIFDSTATAQAPAEVETGRLAS